MVNKIFVNLCYLVKTPKEINLNTGSYHQISKTLKKLDEIETTFELIIELTFFL